MNLLDSGRDNKVIQDGSRQLIDQHLNRYFQVRSVFGLVVRFWQDEEEFSAIGLRSFSSIARLQNGLLEIWIG